MPSDEEVNFLAKEIQGGLPFALMLLARNLTNSQPAYEGAYKALIGGAYRSARSLVRSFDTQELAAIRL
jgi:hypothetical protein